jgi:hypothetical protein
MCIIHTTPWSQFLQMSMPSKFQMYQVINFLCNLNIYFFLFFKFQDLNSIIIYLKIIVNIIHFNNFYSNIQ